MASVRNKKPSASQLIDKRCYPIGSILDRGLPGSFNEAMFYSIVDCVVQDLNKYGLCAIDNFIRRVSDAALPQRICAEVTGLHQEGKLCAGKVVQGDGRVHQHHNIRGDLITWLTGEEQGLNGVNCLIRLVDCVMMAATQHARAGKLTDYQINLRTKAMAACYPGGKSHYVRHVDNSHGDGRVVTAIYYLNSQWQDKDGGQLVIYSQAMEGKPAVIKPQFDRLVFFWSDRRNPHEVLPALATRYAVTLWYLDENQRRSYQQRRNEIDMEKHRQNEPGAQPPPSPPPPSQSAAAVKGSKDQQSSEAGGIAGAAATDQGGAMEHQQLLDELYQYLSEQSTDPALLLTDTGPRGQASGGESGVGDCGDDSFLGDLLAVQQSSDYLAAAALSENSHCQSTQEPFVAACSLSPPQQQQPFQEPFVAACSLPSPQQSSQEPFIAASAELCNLPETGVRSDKFSYQFPTTAPQFGDLTQQFVEQCGSSGNDILDSSSMCHLGSPHQALQQADTHLFDGTTIAQHTLGQFDATSGAQPFFSQQQQQLLHHHHLQRRRHQQQQLRRQQQQQQPCAVQSVTQTVTQMSLNHQQQQQLLPQSANTVVLDHNNIDRLGGQVQSSRGLDDGDLCSRFNEAWGNNAECQVASNSIPLSVQSTSQKRKILRAKGSKASKKS